MNEQDFRDALRQTMTAEPPPPPMSDSTVLDAAHRDRGRRRALWAGASSAAAVVAIAVGLAVVAPSVDEGVQVGGPAAQTTDGAAPPQTNATNSPDPSGEDTKTSWPNGQTDRTATSGPQYDKGTTLAGALDEVIPAGYEAPGDLVGQGDLAGVTLKSHQAQFMDRVNNVEVWSYDAWTPLVKGDGVGELSVNVIMPGGTGPNCETAKTMGTTCTEVDVDGKRVGVYESTIDERHDQTAVYRFEDGTTVSVAQSASYAYAGLPALAGMPLTTDQLARLAINPEFNMD